MKRLSKHTKKVKKKSKTIKRKRYNKNKQIKLCYGKKDGVSGCRTCCKKHKNKYRECILDCMNV